MYEIYVPPPDLDPTPGVGEGQPISPVPEGDMLPVTEVVDVTLALQPEPVEPVVEATHVAILDLPDEDVLEAAGSERGPGPVVHVEPGGVEVGAPVGPATAEGSWTPQPGSLTFLLLHYLSLRGSSKSSSSRKI